MSTETIKVPDMGGADSVEVIEVLVKVGDEITEEQSLVLLESDKASMEMPSPKAGKITKLHVKEGSNVAEGDPVADIEVGGDSGEQKGEATESDEDKSDDEHEESEENAVSDRNSVSKDGDTAQSEAGEQKKQGAEAESGSKKTSSKSSSTSIEEVPLPDIGDSGDVEVIEVLVEKGDTLAEGDSIIVLESDKASMEIPAPRSGKVHKVHVKEGDQPSKGTVLIELEIESDGQQAGSDDEVAATAENEKQVDEKENRTAKDQDGGEQANTPAEASEKKTQDGSTEPSKTINKAADAALEERQANGAVHAGPSVRKLAREMGVNLSKVKGSGPKDRILKDDVQAYVKAALKPGSAAGGGAIPAVPDIDFSKFGALDQQPVAKLDKLTAQSMTRSWLNVPHVTHFDDADITELEQFRATLKPDMEKRGVKLSPLPFIVKACAVALQMNPKFNTSLVEGGEQKVFKQYYHIGLAVDTPAGLMVPVLRDADKKSIWEIAEEMQTLSAKAKDRKLSPAEMQGGCFTISSLGNIGGNGFTPIVNTPEVAILGVSRTAIKPVYINEEFVPRKLLPLSLSYDHRVVNGADAGRFMTDLCGLMADIRRQLL